MRKHQINPNLDILKLSDQYSSKVPMLILKSVKNEKNCQGHERQGTITVWRIPRTHNNL